MTRTSEPTVTTATTDQARDSRPHRAPASPPPCAGNRGDGIPGAVASRAGPGHESPEVAAHALIRRLDTQQISMSYRSRPAHPHTEAYPATSTPPEQRRQPPSQRSRTPATSCAIPPPSRRRHAPRFGNSCRTFDNLTDPRVSGRRTNGFDIAHFTYPSRIPAEMTEVGNDNDYRTVCTNRLEQPRDGNLHHDRIEDDQPGNRVTELQGVLADERLVLGPTRQRAVDVSNCSGTDGRSIRREFERLPRRHHSPEFEDLRRSCRAVVVHE